MSNVTIGYISKKITFDIYSNRPFAKSSRCNFISLNEQTLRRE